MDFQLDYNNLYNNDEIFNIDTNSWFDLNSEVGTSLNQIEKLQSLSLNVQKERGETQKTYYNMFLRVTGVDNKVEYSSDLFSWKAGLEKAGKKVCVINQITPATAEEVEKIQPNKYETPEELINDLSQKIRCPYLQLKNQTIKAFIECMVGEIEKDKDNFTRFTAKGIYLLSWFSRYGRQLFEKNYGESLPVLIYFGVCKNSAESLMLRFFAKLPVDVVVINSSANPCILTDETLLDIKLSSTLELAQFPTEITNMGIGTAGFYAEQELEEIMYKGTGLYRDLQHEKASAITLKTMYEEIYILWSQEVKYREGFEVINNEVLMPTFFAKINGVKNEDVGEYFKYISSLVDKDTVVITEPWFYSKSTENFDTTYAFRNNEFKKQNVVRNKNYKYGIFRETIQMHILDKLEYMLENKYILGTYSTGIEHDVVRVVMNLHDRFASLIHDMDFTKKNPKVVLINNSEMEYGLEEIITLTFLHLIGIDIIVFAPTGYRIMERYLKPGLFVEHNIGKFMYEVNLPNKFKNKNIKDVIENDTIFEKFFKK